MNAAFGALVARSDALRRASRWQEAASGYAQALAYWQDPVVAHNLALCKFALGDPAGAAEFSALAMRLSPELWQTALIHALSLKSLGKKDSALIIFQSLNAKYPSNPEIAVETARMLLQHGGDPIGASRLARPWVGRRPSDEAQAIVVIASLYDRDSGVDPSEISASIRRFAQANLVFPPNSATATDTDRASLPRIRAGRLRSRRRLRVGLLSPQFTVSPVYFFAFGATRLIADEVDLHCFHRGTKRDWATQAFEVVSRDWTSVASKNAEELARELSASRLDVLVDLGGWMDPVGLKALSSRPARSLYKWVGGQSVTTGMDVFDGYLTDAVQTPRGTDRLYSEPLIRLKSGYVTYTPPDYLPAPSMAPRDSEIVLGVVANPAKLSGAFLQDLARRLAAWGRQVEELGKRLSVEFIDQRFDQAAVRQRVFDAIAPRLMAQPVKIRFLKPGTHLEYLTAVADLDAIIDSWPYSGGLTAVEGLSMGVPVFIRSGVMFCERHSASHVHFSGLTVADYQIDKFNGIPPLRAKRKSLMPPGSARRNHQALADELMSVFYKKL